MPSRAHGILKLLTKPRTPSSKDSMLRKNITKLAFAPNELVGATGALYRFKELIKRDHS